MPTGKVIRIESPAHLKNEFGKSTNGTFFDKLMVGLQRRLSEEADIHLKTPEQQKGEEENAGDKKQELSATRKSITLAARKTVATEEEYKDLDDKVRRVMDNLKNPSNLIALID
jgi:hypothetical protein